MRSLQRKNGRRREMGQVMRKRGEMGQEIGNRG